MSQRDYFYYKEHLLIVTELLRDSLFNFYRYLLASDTPDGISTYFSMQSVLHFYINMEILMYFNLEISFDELII